MSYWMKIMCFALLGMVMLPEIAQAQIMNIQLNDLSGVCAGGVPANASLFTHAAGNPNTPTLCNSSAGMFARFFCIMETTLGLIIARTFCAIRDAWMAPFGAMMMLLMAVTGVSFATGIIRFSVKEVSVLIFKMALVTLFVTNAGVAMDIAYKLYVGIMQGTVNMMMKGFNSLAATTSSTMLPYVKQGVQMADSMKDTVGSGEAFKEIDSTIDQVRDFMTRKGGTGPIVDGCSVLTFLGGLLLALPFASMILFFALISFLGFFARAAYGYIYALVMVTFLVAAMPIFVSFALFRSTNDLFEHWLKYMGSNVIQIFIVFAIMAFASMVDFTAFLKQVDDLIVPYEMHITFGPLFSFKMNVCSICDPNFIDMSGAAYVDSSQGLPLLPLTAGSACKTPAALPWGEVIEHGFFLKFLLLNGAALYILTMIMENFMKQGPDIAKALGGARLVHTIGGLSTMGGNAVTSAVHRGTANFEKGAKQSWDADEGGGTFSRIGSAFRGGKEAAVEGPYVKDGEDLIAARKEIFSTNRELGARHEQASEAYMQKQEEVTRMRELYLQGEVDTETMRGKLAEYSRTQREYTRVDHEVRNAVQDVMRTEQTGHEWKAQNRPGEEGSVSKDILSVIPEEDDPYKGGG